MTPDEIRDLAIKRFGYPCTPTKTGLLLFNDGRYAVDTVGASKGHVRDTETGEEWLLSDDGVAVTPPQLATEAKDESMVESSPDPAPALKPTPLAGQDDGAVDTGQAQKKGRPPKAKGNGVDPEPVVKEPPDPDPMPEDMPVEQPVEAPGGHFAGQGDGAQAKPNGHAGGVGKAPAEKEERGPQGRPLELPEPKAWDQAVDGAVLLDGLVETILTYLVMPKEAAQAMALWTVHAHAFDAAEHTPRLLFISPVKRCGKSTGLRVLASLVPRPLDMISVTTAALFRTIEKAAPCVLIDEFDASGNGNEEVRALINSGHSRGGTIVRCVGESYEPRTFAVSAPLAIAVIGRVHGTIEDRSVVLAMRRRKASEPVERFRAGLPSLYVLARQVARWAADHLIQLRQADPVIPAGLNDRAADNWRPLLAIADLAGGDWPGRARNAASVLCGLGDELQAAELGVQLLIDIRAVFDDRKVDRIASADLVDILIGDETMPSGETENGRALTVRSLASRLGRFEIGPKNIRVGEAVLKGYERTHFVEAWERYCR
jgi:hypothetical protein